MDLNQDLLRELFEYKDGHLFWKVNKRQTRVGDKSGCISANGRYVIKLNGRQYLAHRLIYMYHYGAIKDNLFIDHIDNNPLNNCIQNLRLVTNQENQFNQGKAKGYYFNKVSKSWLAQIRINGRKKSIGHYATEKEARIAYLNAKEQFHVIENRQGG